MSIEELENKVKEKQGKENENIKIALESNKRELHKKQIVIRNMENELIDIFSGESSMDKDILVGMITKTKGQIEILEGKIKLLEKEFSEADKVISIDKELIKQYKNFNYVYGTADIKQKKLLLQEVVERITFENDKIIITLYLN